MANGKVVVVVLKKLKSKKKVERRRSLEVEIALFSLFLSFFCKLPFRSEMRLSLVQIRKRRRFP